MPKTISIEEAERDLRSILKSLHRGESVTILDERALPVAALTGLRSEEQETEVQDEVGAREMSIEEWLERMKQFAEEVDAAWKGEKSGLDELREMRR